MKTLNLLIDWSFFWAGNHQVTSPVPPKLNSVPSVALSIPWPRYFPGRIGQSAYRAPSVVLPVPQTRGDKVCRYLRSVKATSVKEGICVWEVRTTGFVETCHLVQLCVMMILVGLDTYLQFSISISLSVGTVGSVSTYPNVSKFHNGTWTLSYHNIVLNRSNKDR